MAEADQRDVLSRIRVPTLLIWGELDARSPLTIARQFESDPGRKARHYSGRWAPQQPRAAQGIHPRLAGVLPPPELARHFRLQANTRARFERLVRLAHRDSDGNWSSFLSLPDSRRRFAKA
jgi:hypothetical protein